MQFNVLQLVGSFHQGGSERQAIQLARLLSQSGRYNVRLATLDAEGVLRADAESLGTNEIPAFPLTSFYDRNMLRQLRSFRRFLRAAKIHVVHTHDFYTNIFGMIGAAAAGVPVRIASRRESGVLRSGAKRILERTAYRFADAVVANCDVVRDQLVAEGVPAAKISVVHNGLDVRRVAAESDLRHAELAASLGLESDDNLRFVTIVANLRLAVKDHPTFLRAAQTVKQHVPHARFIIAGEGELRSALEALAKELNVSGEVFFTGRCTRVAELLRLSAVCVLSSTSEGFSNSILEYMAAARPVVATDVGGAREAITDGVTGYLVSAGDDATMAKRIIHLLKQPERASEMGVRGRSVVEEKFSIAAQLRATENLYAPLLARYAGMAGARAQEDGSDGKPHTNFNAEAPRKEAAKR